MTVDEKALEAAVLAYDAARAKANGGDRPYKKTCCIGCAKTSNCLLHSVHEPWAYDRLMVGNVQQHVK